MPRETLSQGDREQALARLATVLRGLEARSPGASAEAAAVLRTQGGGGGADPRIEAGGVLTGWSGIDALGGLSRGLLHEWFGVAEPESSTEPALGGGTRPRRSPPWTPPLRLLAALAARALAARAGGVGGWVCWIGSKVWPYPRALIPREQVSSFESVSAEPVEENDDVETPRTSRRAGASVVPVSPDLLAPDRVSSDLLASSLFIDPPDDAVRLWAIDLALRCPALAAVVADGRGLTMPASRRLQLAAEKSVAGAGGGPLVLLARPPSERGMPSVAGTRWLVEREAGASSARATTANPRWSVEVLRWKGRGAVLPSGGASGLSVSGLSGAAGLRVGVGGEVGRRWSLEWSHVEGAVVESPVVADGSRAAEGRPPNPGPPDASSVAAGRSSEFLETRAPHDGFDGLDGIGGRAAAG